MKKLKHLIINLLSSGISQNFNDDNIRRAAVINGFLFIGLFFITTELNEEMR